MNLGIMNPTSTPACPETNGLAEAAVKDVKNGTRANLIQSGLHPTWWERSSTCYCFHENAIPKSYFELEV